MILKSQAHGVGDISTNLLPLRAATTSMVVRKTDKHLKNLKENC